jgi:membrane protein YqaA with SNARE-associated domain
VEHGQPAFLGDAGQYPGLHDHLVARLARHPQKPEDFQGRGEQKALGWLKRHGHWCLLLAWTPVVGDGLCLLAGWLRLSFWRSLILIGLGKLLRYALVFLLASQIF